MKQFLVFFVCVLNFQCALVLLGHEKSGSYSFLECRLQVAKEVFQVGEPLDVRFSVRNTHSNSVSMQLSQYSYYNFRFVIKSLQNNKVVEEKDYFYAEKIDNAQAAQDYKTLTLEKYHFYGQSVDLNRYYQLLQPGHYVVQGFFSPVPRNIRPGVEIPTQILHIELQDATVQPPPLPVTSTHAPEPALNPYDTVATTLNAQKNKEWPRYFQYINLNSLMKQYPRFYTRYRKVPLETKSTVMNEFKEYLKTYFSVLGLKSIKSFEVYKTVIDNDKNHARVFVRMQFASGALIVYKKYIFSLYQGDEKWAIYGWQVENIE